MAAADGDSSARSPSMYYRRQKKLTTEHNGVFTPGLATYSNGFVIPSVLNRIDGGKYGSVTKEFEAICSRRMQMINFLSNLHHSAGKSVINSRMEHPKMAKGLIEQTEGKESTEVIVIDSDDEDGNAAGNKEPIPSDRNKKMKTSNDDSLRAWLRSNVKDRLKQAMHIEQGGSNTQIVPYGQDPALVNQFPLQTSWQPSVQYQKVVLQKVPEEEHIQDLAAVSHAERIAETQVFPALAKERSRKRSDPSSEVNGAVTAPRKRRRKNEPSPATVVSHLGVQQSDVPLESCAPMEEEEETEKESDGLDDLWNDMSLAMESSKLDTFEEAAIEQEEEEEEDCNHSFVLKDDLGLVCRVCGVIQKKIDTIFDYQWKKATRSRTSFYDARSKDAEAVDFGAVKISEDFMASDISIHPRHLKQMRPHQLEGFNFLVKNLVTDKPGGCILAHAPGSGKTFMLISFIQSFLAKYPSARPLVVLPKGILSTWKREFQRWQVEDIPLYDFYSVKAEKRTEQLEVLNSWQDKMSILFLGYKQFSTIICHGEDSKVAAACRERLLMVPNLLILDEGHTPRNQDTDVLESLNRVQTPRKVVLSGTLFQNHVQEVFNILNLVRPKFLKMESSRAVVKRVMSQVLISGNRRPKGVADSAFFESVENTLQNDDNFTRKAHVIRHLRELTKDVLHYYKGDFLDELPGLVDFSVFLKLSPKQKDIVRKLESFEKFKRSAVGTAMYIHPCLSEISEVDAADRAANLKDANIDSLIDSINLKDGVKARFFLNILSLANSAGEKLLAFSQYILPMKFLERLLVKMRGWHVGKEIFMISGDTTTEDREWAMEQFNKSEDAKVLFGSIKACGEGISLVGASRVVILDVHLNPSVTRQAIGRAFRPGQEKKVYVYRLVAAEAPEEKFHETAFKKEVIPKLWFEWSEYCSTEDFKLGEIDVDDCEDKLLESNAICQDIKALYKR